MNFYLIYLPHGEKHLWAAMLEISVPDPAAFPEHWYKKYSVPNSKYAEMLQELIKIKDRFNKENIVPIKGKNIFPELEDILGTT